MQEIRGIVGSALIEVPPGDPHAIGSAIIRQINNAPAMPANDANVAKELELFVLARYREFGSLVARMVR
jgi:hypothetical protein